MLKSTRNSHIPQLEQRARPPMIWRFRVSHRAETSHKETCRGRGVLPSSCYFAWARRAASHTISTPRGSWPRHAELTLSSAKIRNICTCHPRTAATQRQLGRFGKLGRVLSPSHSRIMPVLNATKAESPPLEQSESVVMMRTEEPAASRVAETPEFTSLLFRTRRRTRQGKKRESLCAGT